MTKHNIKKIKKELATMYTETVNSCNTLEDIINIFYRNPCCGHCCGISYPIMEILEQNGITEDLYFKTTFPEEELEEEFDDEE